MRIPKRLVAASALLAIAGTSVATSSSICSNEPDEFIPDGCATYGSLEELNKQIRPLVQDITRGTDYFSYYRLDLYGRTCPFWSDDEGMCANIACAVNTIDNQEDIPEIWRAEELGKLAGPRAKHPKDHKKPTESPLGGQLGEDTEESCVVEEDECDERDYCVPEDETGSNGDYVSLIDNPERFTGYAGAGAGMVWKSIYRENCFSKDKQNSRPPPSQAKQGFENIMHDKLTHQAGKDLEGQLSLLEHTEVDDQCLEKRVFYRIISGMHASISVHLCWDYLNQTTGEWGPNLDCFIERFKGHPERIQNIYFNYAILLRAVAKLKNYLPQYTFCSGDHLQNRLTKAKMMKLASTIPSEPSIFDESKMFKEEAAVLKEEFRNRFRNVSRVMDCVGCDKCRLWGKVQTQGYGTALKILFEFDENADITENPPLRRTELVALINTLDRVSHALSVLPKFQELWEKRNRTEKSEGSESNVEKSLSEIFWEEWNLVWSTLWFVFRSWYELPRILWLMGLQEVINTWNKIVGREPGEPLYQWRSDIKSEL
ncbi:endoplasmic reticulum Oxidoreductin 1-domain-containing protein [Sphaerosporella brunnea]|uniref:Endoplasmic reticulum Oxidoreductin 1-domain-containing protein n=1 Tax=Sphaerosporella brunnea TaxID=1250544 RepID=A0A5J5F065_9PEZI|nr:endoplasmic reticulum Oxidoreductin 1-domain-containing protein [Sphaerosporella brunnea]